MASTSEEEANNLEPPSKKIKLDGDASNDEVNPDLVVADEAEEIVEEEAVEEIASRGESAVGITEYISQHPGFSGILKHRYSDFTVHEIDPEGNEVQLTSFEVPVDHVPEGNYEGILGGEVILKLRALQKCSPEVVSIDVTDMDKKGRQSIHEAIRHFFPNLSSATADEGERKVIQVKSEPRKSGQRSRWPPSRGNYLHFVLYKENLDTMDAITKIAHLLRMNPSSFSYAGTKDRRAKTTQWISAYRLNPQIIVKLNSHFKNMATGNFTYKAHGLKLGDLQGNRFTIVLRDVKASKEEVASALEHLKTLGFINYFGMQRFGAAEAPTHQIGLALISQKWEEAVELILKPRTIPDSMDKARKIWQETRDAESAWNALKVKSCIEGHLLRGLKTGNDYVKSLGYIARNTRLMYLHSYQSYVWNRVASKRVKELGLLPVVGDLWMPTTNGDNQPEVVTESDIAQKRVTIYQVVLPLPGHSVTYPEHPTLVGWYKEILAQDGFTLHGFANNQERFYSLGGAYRHVVALPSDIVWDFVPYDDPTLPLFASDLDKLKGEPQPERLEQGKHNAFVIHFTLGTCCYATMALRELLKMDTSPSALKKSSNNAHQ